MEQSLNIHWEGIECPKCGQATLYAGEMDDEGLPNGLVECRSCGCQIHEAVDVREVKDWHDAGEEEAEHEQRCIEEIEEWDEDEWADGDESPDTHYCERCGGTGGEPMDDFITPCEWCDGTGFKWEYL